MDNQNQKQDEAAGKIELTKKGATTSEKKRWPCPECGSMPLNLIRHLSNVHKDLGWTNEKADRYKAENNLRKVRKDKLPTTTRKHKKHECPICKKPVARIHNHLKKSPHWITDGNKYRDLLSEATLFEPGVKIKIAPKLKMSSIVREINSLTVQPHPPSIQPQQEIIGESAKIDANVVSPPQELVEESDEHFCLSTAKRLKMAEILHRVPLKCHESSKKSQSI